MEKVVGPGGGKKPSQSATHTAASAAMAKDAPKNGTLVVMPPLSQWITIFTFAVQQHKAHGPLRYPEIRQRVAGLTVVELLKEMQTFNYEAADQDEKSAEHFRCVALELICKGVYPPSVWDDPDFADSPGPKLA